MKITLNSKYEIHRKIGLMYGGCETNSGGTFLSYVYGSFILFSKQFGLFTSPSITIDLDTAEPDLRLAIGEPISFKAYRPFSNEEVIGAIEEFSCVTGHLKINNIECRAKDIRLSREWLESQGVEVSE